MRLTLRTLLAYLDDTLEPAEIRQIGQKVAESDAAQELIARIRQVTRRRRLTTPPATGPNARFDANTVSEYLDSVLAGDQVAEVEKTCLESDVHLAEIAACHQILTLVLGEPVLVPPTAKRRMYSLVRGKEALTRQPRSRTAAGAAAGAPGDGHEADETLLLGLPPLSRIRGKWMRWLGPVAAVLLIGALGIALWMAVPRGTQPLAVNQRQQDRNKGGTAPEGPKDKPLPEPEPEQLAMKPRLQPDATADRKPIDPGPATAAGNKPGTARRAVGKPTLVSGLPNMLLQRQRGKDTWQRLRPETSPVYTADLLLAPPGFRSEVRLDNKVHLTLWGNVEEAIRMLPPLFESAVILHAGPAGTPTAPDLDFTLDRGRVVVGSQRPDPVRVRVRFHEEIWDLTLDEPGTEVGFELLGTVLGFETGEAPLAILYLVVLRGQARLKVGYNEYALKAPPGPAHFFWDNKGPGARGPISLEQLPPEWNRVPPATKEYEEIRLALDELSAQMTDKVSAILYDNMNSPKPPTRFLATICLGAIDALPELLDALAHEQYANVREAAVSALRHWLGRTSGQDKKIKQALLDKRYTTSQTEMILQLLYTFSVDDRSKKQTYEVLIEYLRHDKPAVRQLAYWHLFRLVPEAKKIPYDAGRTGKQLEEAYEQWQKVLADGKLPPRLPSGPPPPLPK